MRQSMTYDQGREMAMHKELSKRTGVAVYFCDPHSPWQRGSNEMVDDNYRGRRVASQTYVTGDLVVVGPQ